MNKTLDKIKHVAEIELSKVSDPGHDMNHVMRVYNLAVTIAHDEGKIDWEVLQAAALLHDIGGQKEIDDPSGKTDHAKESAKMAEPILKKLKFSDDKIKHIQDCIISHRFKTVHKPKTIEAKILFDADKLDSVGAIGMARSFCWVAKVNASIYKKVNIDKYVKDNLGGNIHGRIQDKTKHSPQIEYEIKTKFLIDKLYTQKAREICEVRIKFTKDFLERLEREVRGEG